MAKIITTAVGTINNGTNVPNGTVVKLMAILAKTPEPIDYTHTNKQRERERESSKKAG
jgi:hypothetical protein